MNRIASPHRQSQERGRPRSMVLTVYRPTLRRWAVVAKLAEVDGERVLGVPYRHRQRLQGRVSLPLLALRYAAEHGATAIIVRFDDQRLAFRLGLQEALRLGRREMLDGQVELWLDLSLFEECPWPEWEFAVQQVRLGPGPEGLPRQLSFVGEGVSA
jgi:hypothetical protein